MDDLEKLREQKLSSTEIFNGRLLNVFRDEVRLPDGSTSTREWIKHPGAAAVLPVFRNGEVMLIKQYRYPLRQVFYEVPAGKIDAQEDHRQTARRELQEETGLKVEKMQYLSAFHPSIGYTDEVIHLYCAWDITKTNKQVDADEFLLTERVSFKKAMTWVQDGKITDGKTMVTLMRAWNWWQQEGPFGIK